MFEIAVVNEPSVFELLSYTVHVLLSSRDTAKIRE